MKTLWDRLEHWAQSNANRSLRLRAGATPAAIAAAEAMLGLAFPADFRASLLLHDGQDGDPEDVFEWMPGCMPLVSLDAMVARWKEEQSDLHDDNPPVEIEDGLLHSVLNHPRRIPIAGNAYWDGDNTYLDLFPGARGTEGQLLTFVSECDLVVLGSSFEVAIERYLRALESGDWVFDAIKGHVTPKGEDPNDYANESFAFATYAAALSGA